MVSMTERDNKELKMSEVKDPKIRLFGKTIELPETAAECGAGVSARCFDAAGEDGSNQEPPSSSDSMLEENGDAEEQESRESLSSPKQDNTKDEERKNALTSEELKESSDCLPTAEDANAPSETEGGSEKMIKNEDDQNETSNSQEKTLKKPDKIIPCPRCSSMDTKFCYFNNYNVNQPRHFCKNCQRYWTAGGTMRNVPVGAGRRKNKNSIPQFRHLTVPEALQGARVDLPNGMHHPALNPNGTVLTFGSDSPLCESMASVLNIADKTNCNGVRNRFHKPEELEISGSDRSKENGDDSSCRSSTTASSSKDDLGKRNGVPEMMSNGHPFPQQVPCYAGGPWPYPWNPVQWNSAVSAPNFPVPFYATSPPPYWACAVPGAWNVPWVMQRATTASQSQTPPTSGPNSPTLGKHSREENILKLANAEEGAVSKESDLERNLWCPKTLRIDDPGEAAKSSIWATLGLKNDGVEAVGSGGGLFKSFTTQSKDDEKSHVSESTTVLQANPAAFSRSLSFQENS